MRRRRHLTLQSADGRCKPPTGKPRANASQRPPCKRASSTTESACLRPRATQPVATDSTAERRRQLWGTKQYLAGVVASYNFAFTAKYKRTDTEELRRRHASKHDAEAVDDDLGLRLVNFLAEEPRHVTSQHFAKNSWATQMRDMAVLDQDQCAAEQEKLRSVHHHWDNIGGVHQRNPTRKLGNPSDLTCAARDTKPKNFWQK